MNRTIIKSKKEAEIIEYLSLQTASIVIWTINNEGHVNSILLDNTKHFEARLDIAPFQYLQHLERLTLNNCNLHDLSPLANCVRLKRLQLDKNNIVDIDPLRNCIDLKSLILNNNQIKRIDSLAHCTLLKGLYLNLNSITDISSLSHCRQLMELRLSNNSISDITSIACCIDLRRLVLYNNQIERITPIAKCKSLKTINLRSNKIKRISSISKCKNLHGLDLRWNQVSDISPISKCENINWLALSNNQVTDISPLVHCKYLRRLDLRNNPIKILPKEFCEFPKMDIQWTRINNYNELEHFITFFDNPIESPPIGILKQGKAAILDYFALLKKEELQKKRVQYNFEVKMLIIGEGGTGKTTLLRRLKSENSRMPKKKETTKGVSINKWKFEISSSLFKHLENLKQKQMLINCWDFGGQKLYHGTHQIFFGENSFYILVAETRDQNTDFNYWFNTIEQLAGDNATLLVVINEKFEHVMKFDLDGFGGRFRFVNKVVALDLQNDKPKIISLQNLVKSRLQEMPQIGNPLSSTYIDIRKKLFDLNVPFISFDSFREICNQHDLKDFSSIRIMSRYFDEIGAITHFIDDPILKNRVYLNSDWLVKTIYRVLDDKLIKNKRGRIKQHDFVEIWNNEQLDFEVDHLCQIMHKFGMMYRIDSTDDYVVPAHLQSEKPYSVWAHQDNGQILVFKFEFDKYMPLGLMSHFIVSLHRFIENQDFVWHRGINIAYENTFAEIIQPYGNTNTFQISLSGMRKIELLAIVRQKFSEVLRPFKKLEYKELVPCNCEKCRDSVEPNFYEYKTLVEFISEDVYEIQCVKSKKMVDVHQLVEDVFPHKGTFNSTKAVSGNRNRVFISYSHFDHEYLVKVQKHLKTLAIQDIEVAIWDDTQIKAGLNWLEEIRLNLQVSKVAILMISTDFLISDFIQNNELPTLLEAAKMEGVIIIPLIIKPCQFAKHPALNQFQSLPNTELSLAELSEPEQDRVLLKLTDRIEEVFRLI